MYVCVCVRVLGVFGDKGMLSLHRGKAKLVTLLTGEVCGLLAPMMTFLFKVFALLEISTVSPQEWWLIERERSRWRTMGLVDDNPTLQ